jgi:hypothetical protein
MLAVIDSLVPGMSHPGEEGWCRDMYSGVIPKPNLGKWQRERKSRRNATWTEWRTLDWGRECKQGECIGVGVGWPLGSMSFQFQVWDETMPDRILTYTIGELEGEGPKKGLYMLEIRAVSASRLEMVMEMSSQGGMVHSA